MWSQLSTAEIKKLDQKLFAKFPERHGIRGWVKVTDFFKMLDYFRLPNNLIVQGLTYFGNPLHFKCHFQGAGAGAAGGADVPALSSKVKSEHLRKKCFRSFAHRFYFTISYHCPPCCWPESASSCWKIYSFHKPKSCSWCIPYRPTILIRVLIVCTIFIVGYMPIWLGSKTWCCLMPTDPHRSSLLMVNTNKKQ